MARLIFKNPTQEQLGHIFQAEGELADAGITFDVGQSMCKDEVVSRDWELDWSLEGAEIKEGKSEMGIAKHLSDKALRGVAEKKRRALAILIK